MLPLQFIPRANNTHSVNGGENRYGFNGQEKDDEVAGEGNSNTAHFWQYDARVARRWNPDPKPNLATSIYACFANNPIFYTDLLGDTVGIGEKVGSDEHEFLDSKIEALREDDKFNCLYEWLYEDTEIYTVRVMTEEEKKKYKEKTGQVPNGFFNSAINEIVIQFDRETFEDITQRGEYHVGTMAREFFQAYQSFYYDPVTYSHLAKTVIFEAEAKLFKASLDGSMEVTMSDAISGSSTSHMNDFIITPFARSFINDDTKGYYEQMHLLMHGAMKVHL